VLLGHIVHHYSCLRSSKSKGNKKCSITPPCRDAVTKERNFSGFGDPLVPYLVYNLRVVVKFVRIATYPPVSTIITTEVSGVFLSSFSFLEKILLNRFILMH
jgi:hypothetical protein